MSETIRLTIPKILMLLCGLILLVTFFIQVPPEFNAAATLLTNITNVIVAFSVGIGTASILTHHGGTIQKRVKGSWYFSVWLILIFCIFCIIGFAYGTNSTQYSWLFNNIFVPVNQTMYALMGVFIVYALYRGFQARNLDVGIMLIVSLLTLMGHAPMSEVFWSGFPWILNHVVNNLNLGGYRAFIICSSIGAIATGIKTLLGRRKGVFGG